MEINNDIFVNDRQHQASFLDWAYDKIKNEMKQIREMEEEFGTAEWYIEEDQEPREPRLTKDQKLEIIKKIDELRDQGYTYRIACGCLDIASSTYTKWRKALNLGKYKGGVR